MAFEFIPDVAIHHLRLLLGDPLAVRVPVPLAPHEVGPHDVVPQRAAAVVPVELGVVDVVVDGPLLVPVAEPPVTLQREYEEPDAEGAEHPQGSEHGHDGSCNFICS